MLSRREFVAGVSSLFPPVSRALAVLLPGSAGAAAAAVDEAGKKGRMIILGFDGVEPSIIDAMLSNGELPNLGRLRQDGGYERLLSSNPPQSPTAWSSFATCKNPGGHGIYDFLRRDPKRYIPGLGFGQVRPARLDAAGALAQSAAYAPLRQGKTFWATAVENGKRAKLLRVPYAYPPENLPGLQMLCGLDVPDIRGTQSTFFAFSDRFAETERLPGGMRLPLRFSGGEATVQVPGLRYPGKREYAEAPMQVAVDRDTRQITLGVNGKRVTLEEKTWSDWLEWDFEITPRFHVRATSRCYVHEAGEHVRLYMTCLQVHPEHPYLPVSAPADYAAELADEYGLFTTVGWSDDTKALQQEELTEALFLQEAERNMAWESMLALDELEAGGFDLFMAGWTSTDRVAHMFWRYRDAAHPLHKPDAPERFRRAIEGIYTRMDEIVGKVMAKLGPNDTLMVLSDHGFKGFRTGFSVNTWLARNGYLKVKGQTSPETAATETKFLQGIDWNGTKAYGLGLGSVFLNLQGREGQGTVPPSEAKAVMAELREKLLEAKDPDSGAPVLHDVYLAPDIYSGKCRDDAPDMQLGFRDGFQMNKASAAGAVPKTVFTPNDDKWSGEHAAADVHHAQGILFCNRPLHPNPAIVDLGVTALARFGIEPPSDYEGKNVLKP